MFPPASSRGRPTRSRWARPGPASVEPRQGTGAGGVQRADTRKDLLVTGQGWEKRHPPASGLPTFPPSRCGDSEVAALGAAHRGASCVTRSPALTGSWQQSLSSHLGVREH